MSFVHAQKKLPKRTDHRYKYPPLITVPPSTLIAIAINSMPNKSLIFAALLVKTKRMPPIDDRTELRMKAMIVLLST